MMPQKPKPDVLDLILAELRALRADLAAPTSRFLTVDEVAARLRSNPKWVYESAFDVTVPWERARACHVLPGRKVAGKWLFHEDLISEYVRGTYERPDAPAPVALRKRAS